MFTRGSLNIQYLCECSTRLASNPIRNHRIRALKKLLHQRWQVTAAIPIDSGPTEALGSDRDGPEVRRPLRNVKRKHEVVIRHWKPHHTADLGLDALGKPADVLMVPYRKRKIIRVPALDESDPNLQLHESIKSELAPLHFKEIKENIEALKPDPGENESKPELELEQYKRLKKLITSGFTRDQLKKYVLESGVAVADIRKHNQILSRSKPNLAAYIIRHIWEYGVQKENGEIETKLQWHNQNIRVPKISLEFALLEKEHPAQIISRKYGVQVAVYGEQKQLRVSGPNPAVELAVKELDLIFQQLPRRYSGRTVEIPLVLQYLLKDKALRRHYFQMLTKRHSVPVKAVDSKPVVVTEDEDVISAIQREMTMVATEYDSIQGQTVWCDNYAEPHFRLRYYPSECRNWFSNQRAWYRLVAGKVNSGHALERDTKTDMNTLVTSVKGCLREMNWREAKTKEVVSGKSVNKVARGQTSDKQMKFKLKPAELYCTYKAELGQVLTLGKSHAFKNAFQKVRGSPPTRFASDIQFLPQVLVQQNFSGSSQTIILRLRAPPKAEAHPDFVIYMTGQDLDKGLQQPIVVRKITAVFDNQSYDVLIPSRTTDIRVSKQQNIDLFSNSSGVSNEKYQRLIEVMRSYIETAQTAGTDIPITWELDLTNVFDSTSALVHGRESSSSIVQQPTLANSTKYILEPPEFLDTVSYEIPSQSGLFLEHILARSGLNELPKHTESLQIVARPVSDLVNDVPAQHSRVDWESTDSLEKLLKDAMNMTALIDEQANSHISPKIV